MAKCFLGSGNSKDVSFEYNVKTQEIEVQYTNETVKEKLPMCMLSDGLRIVMYGGRHSLQDGSS